MTAELVRDEVRSGLADNWDPELTLGEWWERLADGGWAVPTWPEEWHGRAFPRDLAAAVMSELAAAGAVGPPSGLGILLAGPPVITPAPDGPQRAALHPLTA